VSFASLNWFNLQRQWWQGSKEPPAKPLPSIASLQTHTVDFSSGWRFHPADGMSTSEVETLTRPGVDDRDWEIRRLSIWTLPGHPNVKHAILRRTITVPAQWTHGKVTASIRSWVSGTFMDRGRVFVDGKAMGDFVADGIIGSNLDGALTPGSSHLIAIEIAGEGPLIGVKGNAWLSYLPDPITSINLGGIWIPTNDVLHEQTPIHLPGEWNTFMARRTVQLDRGLSGKNAILSMNSEGPVIAVIVNGSYVRRHHHDNGADTELNITPWLRYGGQNRIELVRQGGPGAARVASIALNFYDQGVYP
jgi:hypothetical protein